METLVITKVTNSKDAAMLYSISKRFGKSKLLKGKSRENFELVKIMEEAMKTEDIPLEEVRHELRK